MFDYVAFAEELSNESKKAFPNNIKPEDKKFTVEIIEKFSLLCGDALLRDKKYNFTDKTIKSITQVIAEWMLFKGIDLANGGIPIEYREDILSKIAFIIFEISKKSVIEDVSRDKLVSALEIQVSAIYIKSVEELYEKGLITITTRKNALKNSAVDKLFIHNIHNNLLKNIYSYIYITAMCILIAFVICVIISFFTPDAIINFVKANSFVLIGLSVLLCAIVYSIKQLNWKKLKDYLDINIIELEIGTNLEPYLGFNCTTFRKLYQIFIEQYGYIIPNIKVKISEKSEKNEYSIVIRGNKVDSGIIYPKRYMVIQEEACKKFNISVLGDFITSKDPAFKTEALWIDEKTAQEFNHVLTVINYEDVILTHMHAIFLKEANSILTESDIKKLFRLAKENGFLSKAKLLKKLDYSCIRQILSNLLREKIPIKNIDFILSKLNVYSNQTKNPDILSEKLREDFASLISKNIMGKDKTIQAFVLSSNLEENLIKKIDKNNLLELNYEEEEELINNIIDKIKELHEKTGEQPVLLCNKKLRLLMYRLLVEHVPTIIVSTREEILSNIKINILDTLS